MLQEVFAGSQIGDVSYPGTVGCINSKLLLQPIWRHHCRHTGLIAGPLVAPQRSKLVLSHDPGNTMNSTAFASSRKSLKIRALPYTPSLAI